MNSKKKSLEKELISNRFNAKCNFELLKKIEDARMELKFCKEEEKTLIEKRIIEYRNILIEKNINLVYYVASKYLWVCENRSLQFEDLKSEGIFGLIKAIEKFQIKKGNNLSTYAYDWISQTIGRGVDNKKEIVRKPIHLIEKFKKYKTAERELYATLKRQPRLEEIAEKLKMSPKRVKKLEGYYNQYSISLNEPVNSYEESSTIGDFIEDTSALNPKKEARYSLLRQELKKAFSILDDRELFIISSRYGLGEKKYNRTLQEIGEEFSLSRERIRQIEYKGINKLKNSIILKNLRFYLDSLSEID
jgi:RNA polymerase primary sigma factor